MVCVQNYIDFERSQKALASIIMLHVDGGREQYKEVNAELLRIAPFCEK